jgi:uncharacterized SAM-binding protein YcdF (DUF218 family)
MNNIGFIFLKSISLIFLPPLNCLLLAALGGVVMLRRRAIGRTIVITALLALYLISTPLVGSALRGRLEAMPALLQGHKAQAIVILGGGCMPDSAEYGGDTVGGETLQRLRWAAHIHKQTGLPMLTSGGKLNGLSRSEADLMSDSLQQDFGMRVRWVESQSINTLENGLRSHEILAIEGITRVLLVTHAWHMPRAELAFRRAGFEVVAAPTAFQSPPRLSAFDFIASMGGLHDSTIYFHESLGMLWYRLRFLAGAIAT